MFQIKLIREKEHKKKRMRCGSGWLGGHSTLAFSSEYRNNPVIVSGFDFGSVNLGPVVFKGLI